jgi:glycosyltransferase involved in cell wall biosynthesis
MRILFITHNASRSGAPLVLYYFMKWLKEEHPSFSLNLLFVKGGVLEADFTTLCDNTYYIEKSSIKFSFTHKILQKFGLISLKNNTWLEQCVKEDFDLIYGNTIVSVPYGIKIKNECPRTKLLIHVHEMETIISTLLPKFDSYIHQIDRFIAVSIPVKNNLTHKHALLENKIDLIYECSVLTKMEISEHKSKSFVVGASGLSYWRKGNDFFLQVARYVKKHYPLLNITFEWVGHEYDDKPIIDSDIEKLGLQKTVSFVGEVVNPYAHFSRFDVFLMVSREDPFPLVCIEIAQLQKPIICFEGATGTADIISKGGGYVVPYLDTEAVAEKIVYYYKNRDVKEEHGQKAASLFSDFTPEIICPKIYQTLKITLL